MDSKLSPNEIQKLMQDVIKVEEVVDNDFARIAKEGINLEDKIIVFLLGFSGTGKTTLYYALTEKELKVIKDRRKLLLEAVVPEDNFPIMNGESSHLNAPAIKYDEKNDIIFCDCPCFDDDRGDIQEIINSFAICRAISHAKRAKVLLVETIDDIESAKGKAVRDSCDLVDNLFHDQQFLDSSVALIISNVDPEYSDELFLQNVAPGNVSLLKTLQENENGNNKHIFTFSSPTKEMVDNIYTGFENKDSIIKFIKDCQPVHLNPTILLSNYAKLAIISSIDSFGSLKTILKQFVDQIQYDYSLSDDDLDNWKQRLEELLNTKISSPKDFVCCAKKIIPLGSKYEEIYTNVLKIDKWRSFLERICPENDLSSDQLLSRQNQIMSEIFLDISEFLNEKLMQSLEIINHKIKMRKHQEEEDLEIQALKNDIREKQEKTQKLIEETNKINKNGDEIEKELSSTTNQYLERNTKQTSNKSEYIDQNKKQTCLLI